MSEKEALPGANPIDSSGEVVFYQQEGKIQLPVRVENDTVWLTIEQMTFLFGKSRSTINEHILNAFTEGELEKNESVKKIGNSDFSKKPTNFYNLDVIISVGYRVKSIQGTQFRRWAVERLRIRRAAGALREKGTRHHRSIRQRHGSFAYVEARRRSGSNHLFCPDYPYHAGGGSPPEQAIPDGPSGKHARGPRPLCHRR
jgi:hypothetical protein